MRNIVVQNLLKKQDINSEELIRLLEARTSGEVEFLLIDVREDLEYNEGHIKGVDMLKPTTAFHEWAQTLLKDAQDKTLIFTCRTGNRSAQVQNAFINAGHKSVINHYGGIVTYRGETAR